MPRYVPRHKRELHFFPQLLALAIPILGIPQSRLKIEEPKSPEHRTVKTLSTRYLRWLKIAQFDRLGGLCKLVNGI